MRKLNHEAAPNLNLSNEQIKNSNLVPSDTGYGYSEELSDGGERNEYIANQKRSDKNN